MLAFNCDWVRHYLKSNPDLDKSDRTLCDGVPVLAQPPVDETASTPIPEDFSPALQAIAADYYTRVKEAADRKYLENFPNIIEKSRDNFVKSDAYINKGVIHFRRKEYKRAIEAYEQAIELNSNNVDAYINRGISYSTQQKHQQAIEDYQRAIAIDDKNVDAYISKGMANSGLGKHELAIEDYQKAIALSSNNGDAYYAKGFTLTLQKGKKLEAIEAYQKAADYYQQTPGKESYARSALKRIGELQKN